MARFYGSKIRSGAMTTLDEVPKLWRAQTEKWLEQNNN